MHLEFSKIPIISNNLLSTINKYMTNYKEIIITYIKLITYTHHKS